MSKRFYNAHLHCFTYDHVPEYFLSRLVGVSSLLKWHWLQKIIKKGVEEGKLGIVIQMLIVFLHRVLGINKQIILRYLTFFQVWRSTFTKRYYRDGTALLFKEDRLCVTYYGYGIYGSRQTENFV